MKTKIKIKNRFIGESYPCYVVAELSGNHNGKLSKILKLIDKAKKAGVDAVKIQAYQADTITINSVKEDFRIKKNNSWEKYKNLYNLYKKAQTPFSWLPRIFSYCKKKKITVFASVFDTKSIKILEKLKCPAYKIASPEITDISLIKEAAKTGKPIIISTGLADFEDIKLAYNTISKVNKNLIILKCTSAYPTKLEEVNLNTIFYLKKKFKCPIGFSDHTLGINTPILAASMGCNMIEKHLVENGKKTVDSFFSLDDKNFSKMVNQIRANEIAKGKISLDVSNSSLKNLNGRRSLYVVKKIKKGEKINKNNVRSIRPSYGLHPKFYERILGKKVKKNLEFGERMLLRYVKK